MVLYTIPIKGANASRMDLKLILGPIAQHDLPPLFFGTAPPPIFMDYFGRAQNNFTSPTKTPTTLFTSPVAYPSTCPV